MNTSVDTIIQSSYFFLLIFSVIVFFDVLIRFKSPIQVKFYFLSLIASLGTTTFSSFIMTGPDQFILLIISCKLIFATSLIQIFTNIYFIKQRFFANVYSAICVSFLLILIIYVFKHETTVLPKYNAITTVLDQREFDLILPPYLKVFVFFFFIGFNAFSLYYSYCILFVFSFKNVYFKRVQLWTIAFFGLVIFAFISALIASISPISNSGSIYASLFAMLYSLLIILYRPNFINKNGSKISFGHLFNRNDFSAEVRDIDFNYHFFTNYYFKNKAADIVEFSNIMGVTKDVMFNYIYFNYSFSFDELVNKARVDYFVEIIKDPKYKNYKVEALAMEVGFSSRQRFYQPFKKYHGGNPSDLIEILND